MRAFVTVGSTRFDALIQEVIKEDILLSLSRSGYDEVSIQCGNSSFEFSSSVADGSVHDIERAEVSVSCWKFKPNLEEEYEEADLVISHAGELKREHCAEGATTLPIWLLSRFWDHTRRPQKGKASDSRAKRNASRQSPA